MMRPDAERAPGGEAGARHDVSAGQLRHPDRTAAMLPAEYLAVRATLPKTPERRLNLAAAYPRERRRRLTDDEFARKVAELVAAELRQVP